MNNVFYVYALLDPRKPGSFQYRNSQLFDYEPFYIGKGKGTRCFHHIGQIKNAKKENTPKSNKIRKIFREAEIEPIIVKVQENLFEEQAFELECFLIKQLGRNDLGLGPLCNLTDGGEGPSCRIFSMESRKKMSISHIGKTGEQSYWFNKKHSEETKQKIRQNLPAISGEKHQMYGKHHTIESKRKNSEAHIGLLVGEKNGMYGKPGYWTGKIGPSIGKKHSEETKQKMREAHKRRNQKKQQDSYISS